uniref:RecQ mediated genome instability protein 1 OB-fold domain-containing protein n=1 Tax=Amphimedon queenslandica TaxID=400682 RepID=A0A1X7V065_AMPQE
MLNLPNSLPPIPSSPPGTKLLISSKVNVVGGFLLLTDKSTVILGGHVEHMVKKWNLEKENLPHAKIARFSTSNLKNEINIYKDIYDANKEANKIKNEGKLSP